MSAKSEALSTEQLSTGAAL